MGQEQGQMGQISERASGSVVALAAARLPASVRSPVIATLVSHRVLRPMCVGVRACVWRCVCLSMVRFETTQTASSVLSPVSMGD